MWSLTDLSEEKFGSEIRKRNSEEKFGREIRKRNSEEKVGREIRKRHSEEQFGRDNRKRNRKRNSKAAFGGIVRNLSGGTKYRET